MRITYIHQYFNTPSMSGGTRSYEMARRLVAMGHSVTIVTSSRETDDRKKWYTSEVQGVQIHWLPILYSNKMSYIQRILSFIKFAWCASVKTASIPADVIFATSTPLTVALPGILASKCQKAPMVFEVRDLWPELPIAVGALRNPIARIMAQFLERTAYHCSAEIVTLSPGMSHGVHKLGIPYSRITEIPNSSDLELFYPNSDLRKSFRAKYSIKDDQILIVYAGTFGLINGVKYLVQLASELLSDIRFRFIAIGDGKEYKDTQDAAADYGVLNVNFHMSGPIPKSEMPTILAAADISTSLFIPIPEMESNSANKFFDGLAAGCCMAINYGGWQAELLKETGAGLQIDRDVKIAAGQLQELVNTPGRLAKAKLAARNLAESKFSRDQLAIRLEGVLNRAVKNYANM